MSSNPVAEQLAQWPRRRAILEDARKAEANLDIAAIHRWFTRGSVPAKYWRALVDGAKKRGIPVTEVSLTNAHASQCGNATASLQGQDQ